MSTTPPPPAPGDPGAAPGPAPAGAPGTTSDDTPRDPGRPPGGGTDGFFDAVRRAGVSRSDDRWVGGVAAGVAERFGVDPLLVRGILFVTFFLSGAGLVLYGVAWALLPERSDGRIHLQEAFRGTFDVALLGAVPMVLVGLSWSGRGWSWWDHVGLGWLTGLLWVAAIVVLAVIAVPVLRRDGVGRPSGGTGAPGPTPHAPVADASAAPASGTEHASTADAPWGSPGPVTAYPAPTGPQDAAPDAPRPPRDPAPAAGLPQASPRPHTADPRRPKHPRGPGATTTGVVVGLSLLLGAFLLVVERQGDLAWPVFATWAGLSAILAGLAVVVSGLRGRTSGGLGWLAAILLIVALPVSAWPVAVPGVLDDSVRTVGNGSHSATDPADAEPGFALSVGDLRVDLSDLDLSDATASDPVEVPIELGAGDLTVVLPDGEPVHADVQVVAGDVQWRVDGDDRGSGGVATEPVTFENDEVAEGAEPLLVLDVVVGAGQAIFEED
ncbi:PspC domain-containing protein [Cellulosimicrobium marinum]|uniref:PspC domain-containing protein n=1 Tax=Cellulosimicrobium marinum TaxID=1638992 RepID=UPI001E3DEB20|nr:PspC domain-containing protein [Cellulosimicrobium marinum]MCB7136687.1 PspC domain-containing protein [Cellulosimicrobium marinum]